MRICFGKKAAEKEAGKNKEKQKKALKKNEKPCLGRKPEARFFVLKKRKETRKKPIKSTKKARKRKRNFQGGKREQKKEPKKIRCVQSAKRPDFGKLSADRKIQNEKDNSQKNAKRECERTGLISGQTVLSSFRAKLSASEMTKIM